MLKAFIWVQYVRDNNGTLVVTDPNEGTDSLRVFQSPDRPRARRLVPGVRASSQATRVTCGPCRRDIGLIVALPIDCADDARGEEARVPRAARHARRVAKKDRAQHAPR